MAVYRDKSGHWVSKEEDNQECKHSGFAKGLGVELMAKSSDKTFGYPKHIKSQDDSWEDLKKQGYSIKKISLADLLNDDPGLSEADDLGSYHDAIWGNDPSKFNFDTSKVKDWGFSDGMYGSKKGGKTTLGNGRHRAKALANSGYDYVEIPFRDFDMEEKLVEGLGLSEDLDKIAKYAYKQIMKDPDLRNMYKEAARTLTLDTSIIKDFLIENEDDLEYWDAVMKKEKKYGKDKM